MSQMLFANRENVQNTNEKKSKSIIYAIICASAIVTFIVALLVAEKCVNGKLVIKNNSKTKIESVTIWFDAVEDSDELVNPVMTGENLSKGDKFKYDFGKIVFEDKSSEYTMNMRIKFEGYDEYITSCGRYTGNFSGRIKLAFRTNDDEDIVLDVKTGSGLFMSRTVSDCDNTFYILLDKGVMFNK